MKSAAENKQLFEEAHQLRLNIRECLHSRAKNTDHKGVCSSDSGNNKSNIRSADAHAKQA